MNPAEHLGVTLSRGRRTPIVTEGLEGIEVIDRPSTPCPGCGQTTAEDAPITKVHRVWWHHECAREWMQSVGETEAWLVLANQIAESPSRYKTTEIRVVMQRLLRMLADQEGN